MLNSRKKIVSLSMLRTKLRNHRRKHRKIAFTNGCFDVLHFGHVSYLEAAKQKDRILVVGLNSDSSVRKLKGAGRPINSQQRRAAVLAALACVDYVVIFKKETPYELIKAIHPDILLKGADWKGKVIVGQDIVQESGGRVELVKYIKDLSTSNLIKLMKNSGKR